MASVVFDKASRVYPGQSRPAVDQLDLEVADGEFLVLVGPSGCGKSTSLRMLAGLEEVNDGRILIGDRDVTDVPPKDRDIAMVFQNYALYPHMTVAENMGFALKIAGVNKEERANRVLEAAKLLDLEDYLGRKPKALSGGQRQRVAMGRAIVPARRCSSWTSRCRTSTRSSACKPERRSPRLPRRLGVTTVYVTHDQVEAMTMGDRIAVLKDGVLQQVGHTARPVRAPANVFVAGFIGSPAMNLFDADIVDGGLKFGTATAKVDRASLAGASGKKVTIGVRPEDVMVSTSGEGLPVEVDIVEELGADGYLYGHTEVNGAKVEIVVRVDGRVHPNAGDKVIITPQPDHIHVFDLESGERLSKQAVETTK